MIIRVARQRSRRDRFFVERDDGTEACWEVATYGDRLPHDLVRLAAESALSLPDGVWARVAAGADLGARSMGAKRTGGMDGYAEFTGANPHGLVRTRRPTDVPRPQ